MKDEERILSLLKKVKGDYFAERENLISDGYINSVELIELVSLMEQEFGIDIPLGDLRVEKFDNLNSIAEIIEEHMH